MQGSLSDAGDSELIECGSCWLGSYRWRRRQINDQLLGGNWETLEWTGGLIDTPVLVLACCLLGLFSWSLLSPKPLSLGFLLGS